MSPLRILVADDHEVVRRGLCALKSHPGWDVCAEVSDGREAGWGIHSVSELVMYAVRTNIVQVQVLEECKKEEPLTPAA